MHCWSLNLQSYFCRYFIQAVSFLFCLLNRFAQFFTHPLFTASATEREVNAVNSENDRNLQSDPWRSFQLEKSQAKEGHDFAKFGTGKMERVCIQQWVGFFFHVENWKMEERVMIAFLTFKYFLFHVREWRAVSRCEILQCRAAKHFALGVIYHTQVDCIMLLHPWRNHYAQKCTENKRIKWSFSCLCLLVP